MEKFLIYNGVQCLECGEVLNSVHRHDFKVCGCPNKAMVDGGLEYNRHGAKDMDKLVVVTHYSDEPHFIVRDYIVRGSRGVDGKQPLTYIPLKDIDDDYLQAIIDYEEELRPNNRFLPIYKAEVEWRKK